MRDQQQLNFECVASLSVVASQHHSPGVAVPHKNTTPVSIFADVASTMTKKRARPGEGKTPWGLSRKKWAEIASRASNPQTKKDADLRACLTFVGLYIAHARDLAQSGRKDDARDWCRFFKNSQIVRVLASHLPASETEKISADLTKLSGECHPLDVANFATDLQFIRSALSQIITKLDLPSPAPVPCCKPKKTIVQNYAYDRH